MDVAIKEGKFDSYIKDKGLNELLVEFKDLVDKEFMLKSVLHRNNLSLDNFKKDLEEVVGKSKLWSFLKDETNIEEVFRKASIVLVAEKIIDTKIKASMMRLYFCREFEFNERISYWKKIVDTKCKTEDDWWTAFIIIEKLETRNSRMQIFKNSSSEMLKLFVDEAMNFNI